MHPDIHLLLHHARAAELRGAAPSRRRHPRLRTRVGWTMVELGLRLVSSAGNGPHRHRFGGAGMASATP
ncbi:hypothetical protein SALBM135S_09795 [Streptomyces alboniger]